MNRTLDGRIDWGDEHVQKSSVVNITHVDVAGQGRVVLKFWHLAALVAVNGLELGVIVGLAVFR